MIKNHVITLFEVTVTLLSSYLASQAFISISIFNNIFSPAISQAYAIMIVIISMGFLFYGNFKMSFYLNILLYLPEALSFSRINVILAFYTNYSIYEVNRLATITLQNFSTTRSFDESLFTGIVIMAAYLTLFFTSRLKNTSLELETRGAEKEDATTIAYEQFKILLSLMSASVIITVGLSYSANLVSSLLHQIALSYDARYIVLGILGSSIMIITLLVYMKNYSKDAKEKQTLIKN